MVGSSLFQLSLPVLPLGKHSMIAMLLLKWLINHKIPVDWFAVLRVLIRHNVNHQLTPWRHYDDHDCQLF